MTPRPSGVRRRFPAEWEPCDAVWLAWPHNPDTWPGHFEPVPEAFARFAQAIAQSTPVRILAAGSLADRCRIQLSDTSNIEWFDIPTNDCWIRDFGPTFVFESRRHGNIRELVAIDWNFNAWGGKYEPHDLDAAAGARIAAAAGVRRRQADLTIEGGALETDGFGRLLVNPACVLDPNRNPHLLKSDVVEENQKLAAQSLHRFLGVDEIVWIDGGSIPGDDTDGHIDQVARFVDRENVVVAVAGDLNDPGAEGLETNFRQLRLWSTQTSPAVSVHRLPMPPPRSIDGLPVPQSYCNFLRIGPERLLCPTFANPASDDQAIAILRELCPGVEIVPIPSEDIAWGLGALHCASCHQPANR